MAAPTATHRSAEAHRSLWRAFLLFGAALLAITYLLVRAADNPSGVELSGNSFRVVPQSAVGKLEQLTAAYGVYQSGQDLSHLLVRSGVALVIMAVFAVVLGWIVAGRALLPVSIITATARRISATNLHQRLDLNAADEEFREWAKPSTDSSRGSRRPSRHSGISSLTPPTSFAPPSRENEPCCRSARRSDHPGRLAIHRRGTARFKPGARDPHRSPPRARQQRERSRAPRAHRPVRRRLRGASL